MASYIIRIQGIELYGFHGCLPEEAKIGTNYIIDVVVETDFAEAALNDDLAKTVDYCDIYNIVKQEMAVRSKLIESVALRIVKTIKNNIPRIITVEVTVNKLNPPVNGYVQKTSVTIKE